MSRVTGKALNQLWGVGAVHALYREDGKWYHHLEQFPGALFDKNGYVLFGTRAEYLGCNHLRHGQDLNVTGGIKNIRNYVRMC
jgi:5-methylcytosine-specific restriction protein A